MAEHPISKKAQSFLSQHIRSVEQLEIFLTLAREPQKAFSVEQIFKQIQSSEKSIATALGAFAEQGLATEGSGRFRFAEKPESLHEIAAELQGLYRERRVFIIELIYSKTTDSIETFAEAFRLRKKP